jgi:hypothetical protein
MEGWEVTRDCGVCRGFVNGAECKSQIDNDDPRLTASQLCILGLVNTLERNREGDYTDNMTYAWECIETSLASCGAYPSFSIQRMSEAFTCVDAIIRDRTRNIVETCEAVSLKDYEPLFRARAAQQPITRDMIEQVRDDVGALICAIDEAEDVPRGYDGFMSGFMAEEIVSWLALYGGEPDEVIYPTSHREGRSNMTRFNHDRYQLHDETKVPVEIKRRHRHRKPSRRRHYERPIIKIVLQDILDQTRSRHGSIRTRRDNFLIDYIRHDLTGRDSMAKNKVLKTASTLVLGAIERGSYNMLENTETLALP